MIPSTVTVAGWTGDEAGPNGPSIDAYRERLWERLDTEHPGISARLEAKDPEAQNIVREAGMDYMLGFFVARAHRDAAPLANELTTVTTQALAAVEQASNEYADLSRNTTVNWLAAHHRFVLTTQLARQLLEKCVQIAEALLPHREHLIANDIGAQIYARFVPAEHRITMPDLVDLKAQVAEFVEISTSRFAATRVTITGGYPDGFAPAPFEADMPAQADGEEMAWTTGQFAATPAIVADARGW